VAVVIPDLTQPEEVTARFQAVAVLEVLTAVEVLELEVTEELP
jgi:hypothetical protein